jgi:hypothetical protein
MPEPYTFVTPQPGKLIMRDYGKEFGTTSEALQAQAQPLLGLYSDIMQRYTPSTMTALAGTTEARLASDLARLQRAERGELTAEEIRNAQQAAREAYGARGQVFSEGASAAEVLNRRAVQQANEDRARQAYQQSIGNLAQAANLQTGNIFQPISSLLAQTFSPTSAYANAVYDYNVNAYNSYQAAQENLAAYKEAAKMGQQDQFLAAFSNFLLKNGIQTTASQIGKIFEGIVGLGSGNSGMITPTVAKPTP